MNKKLLVTTLDLDFEVLQSSDSPAVELMIACISSSSSSCTCSSSSCILSS